MTSLFDQYEQDSQRSTTWKGQNTIVSYEVGDEKPIFQKNRINFTVPSPIIHLEVCNEVLVLVMSNYVLWRIDLKTQNKVQEVELNRIVPGVTLTGLFLSPNADHLLISFSTELLYLNRRFGKPKPATKLKSHEVTAVGWSSMLSSASTQTTKPVLLGTSRGIIFELEISADEGIFSSSIEIYCKQVFDLGKGNPLAITGLQYYRIDGTDNYFVIATTVHRLYSFIGKNSGPDDRPLLQQLFNKYLGLPEGFMEIPGRLDYSRLQLYSPPDKSGPTSLGWLTETGIYYAQIDPKLENQLLHDTKMFPIPEPAISFLMTEFHILLLYPNCIKVISSLSEDSTSCPKEVFTDYYNEMYGQLLNILRDPVKGTIWVYAERAVFRYIVHNEDRYVWQIYADKGDYDTARSYCKNSPLNMDKVLVRQAEAYFKEGRLEESARCFADTMGSFEEIVLKFVQNEGASKKAIQGSLKAFLREKVKKVRSEDPARTTMLVLWVLELLLSELSELRTHGRHNSDDYVVIQAELDEFISDSHTLKCLRSNKRAVYDLMASHGDESNMVKLAKLTEDYKRVIEHFIYKGDHLQALDTLKEQSNAELWYYFAPDLVDAEPKATLTAIRQLIRPLDPSLLLPALIAADNSQPEEVIKYLEYCTNELNCQEQAIHNFFLTLLAQHKPDMLLIYLSLQGDDSSMVNYDIRYGMRVCKEYKRREACVKLMSMLGLWEAAVDLALEFNVQLAISTVSQLQSSRKLWLKIAEHVVKEKNDINQAVQFLKQSDLKIEDILPFFPDFVTIDNFKDSICSSLQEYNQHIQDLKEEMEDATKSAEIIRNEIQDFRSKFTVIQMTDQCCLCSVQVLLKPFYSFPCGHRFHSDCLYNETLPLLPEKTKADLQFLRAQLDSNLRDADREKKALEMNAILAAQCLFCGDLMIDLIDKPFIPEEDFEKILQEWA